MGGTGWTVFRSGSDPAPVVESVERCREVELLRYLDSAADGWTFPIRPCPGAGSDTIPLQYEVL